MSILKQNKLQYIAKLEKHIEIKKWLNLSEKQDCGNGCCINSILNEYEHK